MKLKLTKKICDDAVYTKPEGSRTPDWLWDTKQEGLGLRINPGGGKSWWIQYRVDGRRRFMKLESKAKLTVDEARTIAKKRLGEVADNRDPADEKQGKRQVKTVNDLCGQYELRHLPRLRATARPKRVVKLLRERWGTRKVTSITRAEVAALHNDMKETPYEANRTIETIRKMWSLAEVWGFVPDGHPNPVRKIDKFKEVKRERFVTREEMPTLMAAIEAYPNAWVRAALKLDLFTGARLRSELLRAKWSDVDFDRKELRFPETKQGTAHVVPLSSQAMALLEGVPRMEGNEYIFPGRHGRGHLANVQKCWEKIRRDAGLSDVRLHDLRRTAGSWLAIGGSSLVVIGKALGHSQQSTTAVYARLSDDPVREALERHGAALATVGQGDAGAKVVPLKKPTKKRTRAKARG